MEEIPPPPPPPPPPPLPLPLPLPPLLHGAEENNKAEGCLRRKFHSALRWRLQKRRAKSKLKHVADESDRNSSFLDASSSSTPSSTDTEEGGDGAPGPAIVGHGSVSLIGRRREMEDALTEAPGFLASHDFFAVFDGHGGATVAETCRERMHVVLAEEAAAADGDDERWRAALAACFAKVDREVSEAAETKTLADGIVGSTAVVVVIGERRIVVANCGVSRAVLCRGGAAVPLSNDHKPNRPDELERVEAAGGRVINWNGHRIMGVLATSRSIGDLYFKPFVTSEPEVKMIYRTEKDEFLIVASDGLWDVVSNDVACRVVRQCFTGRTSKQFPEEAGGCTAAAATLLARRALSRGSTDNISVVVVQLKRFRR